MKRTTIRAAAAAALAVAVLAACGGDDNAAPEVSFATVPQAGGATTTGVTSTTTATTEAAATTAPASTAATTTAPTTSAPGTAPVVQIIEGPATGRPVDLAVRPGDSRLYVANQDGIVNRIDGGTAEVALDLTDLTDSDGEQGLLGLAFHPTEPLAYVNYSGDGGATVIAEYAVAADGSIDPASARIVMTIDQPYANHNGGDVAFGPDGLMYIGMGDGGSANDPERRSLNVSSLLGKMLRIDPLANGGDPYTVPADNPFVGVPDARGEIWSVGVRNPWRFSFDSVTGDLWIADVGQNAWEEISVGWAEGGANGGRGLNFGWSAWEGNARFNTDQPEDGHTPPIHEYAHGDDTGCSISGGVLYRGTAIPELAGWYVYADYCSSQVRAVRVADRAVTDEITIGTVPSPTAVAAGPDGELWVLSGDGPLYQLTQG
jgi:glucose/arabinose dehydrogenase